MKFTGGDPAAGFHGTLCIWAFASTGLHNLDNYLSYSLKLQPLRIFIFLTAYGFSLEPQPAPCWLFFKLFHHIFRKPQVMRLEFPPSSMTLMNDFSTYFLNWSKQKQFFFLISLFPSPPFCLMEAAYCSLFNKFISVKFSLQSFQSGGLKEWSPNLGTC